MDNSGLKNDRRKDDGHVSRQPKKLLLLDPDINQSIQQNPASDTTSQTVRQIMRRT